LPESCSAAFVGNSHRAHARKQQGKLSANMFAPRSAWRGKTTQTVRSDALGATARSRPAKGVNGHGVDLNAVLRAYRRYAPTYDLVFGAVFDRGRVATAKRANELPGRRVLELGVGTGLSLPRYRADREIVGIDISPEMLSVASRRIAEFGLPNVGLARMDGEHLAFPDASFDIVVAMFVISVTPDPRRCLAEMQRVCAPGGAILICNHLIDGAGERSFSRELARFSRWLGWRPDFRLQPLLEGSPLTIEANGSVPPFGMFKVVTLRKH
jgi:phosphatidylethanolamine/phosphatidyl-N-methylethanolamine N-methyltransferase